MGVDEIYRGKNGKFLTVVSNLETNRRVFKAYMLKKAWNGSGTTVRRGNGQLPGEVDGSTALAAPAPISEARRHVG